MVALLFLKGSSRFEFRYAVCMSNSEDIVPAGSFPPARKIYSSKIVGRRL